MMHTTPSKEGDSMKEKTGEVFSIGKDNAPIPGCTISKEVYGGDNYITYFSLISRVKRLRLSDVTGGAARA